MTCLETKKTGVTMYCFCHQLALSATLMKQGTTALAKRTAFRNSRRAMMLKTLGSCSFDRRIYVEIVRWECRSNRTYWFCQEMSLRVGRNICQCDIATHGQVIERLENEGGQSSPKNNWIQLQHPLDCCHEPMNLTD